MLGPLGILLEVVDALMKADQEVTEMSKSLNLTKKEALGLRNEMSIVASTSNDIFVTTTKLIQTQATSTRQA